MNCAGKQGKLSFGGGKKAAAAEEEPEDEPEDEEEEGAVSRKCVKQRNATVLNGIRQSRLVLKIVRRVVWVQEEEGGGVVLVEAGAGGGQGQGHVDGREQWMMAVVEDEADEEHKVRHLTTLDRTRSAVCLLMWVLGFVVSATPFPAEKWAWLCGCRC